MADVRQAIARVAPTTATVLLLGETGTGKELAARAVHELSLRADQPFVAVNCGALPESLIESELFGHRKGAFTGAEAHRTGLFEVASGGTLFLDEIGEMPKSLQAKLLRVLESGEIRRLGDNETFQVDVRVICATHRNLEEMAALGEFREDLMFRINTFEIRLPTLRERVEDIADLAGHLLARFRGAQAAAEAPFSDDALEALVRHCWPGNVRELANVVEHAAILCPVGPVDAAHLPANFTSRRLKAATWPSTAPLALRDLEMQAIMQALDRFKGNKARAAEALGISVKTLYNKLNQSADLEKSA
jgi:two-component system NtrC family response regulator